MGMDEQTRSVPVGADWGTAAHQGRFAVGFCLGLLAAVIYIIVDLWLLP